MLARVVTDKWKDGHQATKIVRRYDMVKHKVVGEDKVVKSGCTTPGEEESRDK